jgi:hypothetical protein
LVEDVRLEAQGAALHSEIRFAARGDLGLDSADQSDG